MLAMNAVIRSSRMVRSSLVTADATPTSSLVHEAVLAGLVSVFGNGLRSRRHREGVEDSSGQPTAFGAAVWTRITVLESAFWMWFPTKAPPPPLT